MTMHRSVPLLAAGLLAAGVADAAQVRVAVASNFAQPMQRIAEAFTAATGHVVQVSTGSTGKLHAQVKNGAPFEVLIAADESAPGKLIAEGHAVAGSNVTYALGRLVLWSARPGFVDDQGAVLASDQVKHVAIASPKVAPYGAAAMQVIRARGLADALARKLVTGESVGQAHQFVATGNADVGFVAWSQVALPGRPVAGSYWLVPASLVGEIRQDAVLLDAGRSNPAAKALLSFLAGDAARQVIRDFGYVAPVPQARPPTP
jgi:molybdate transport system substrate-binding protein